MPQAFQYNADRHSRCHRTSWQSAQRNVRPDRNVQDFRCLPLCSSLVGFVYVFDPKFQWLVASAQQCSRTVLLHPCLFWCIVCARGLLSCRIFRAHTSLVLCTSLYPSLFSMGVAIRRDNDTISPRLEAGLGTRRCFFVLGRASNGEFQKKMDR